MSPIALPVAELKPALTGLAKVINRHAALPVLNHVKIERTADGWVALTGTDLDRFVTVRLEQPASGDPSALLVPCDELLKATRSRGKETIFVEPGADQTAIIRYPIGAQFAETRVASLPVEEFPAVPDIGGEPIAVDAALRSSLLQALECASTDETRLILNGAWLDVSKPRAHDIVGTDGRHLFSSNSFALPLKESLLIPSHRFLGWKEFGADGEWQLRVGEKTKDAAPLFQLSSRRWRFISRQIEGHYPNWRQVVPDGRSTRTTIEVDPDAVAALLQTVARMPDHDAVNHGLGLEVIGPQLRLLGRSSRDGDWTRVGIDGVKVIGTEVTAFLNRELFAKALRFGLTRIEIIDPMSPLRFSQGGRQMIVMPVRAESAPTRPQPAAPTTPVATPHEPRADQEPKAHNPPPPADPTERNPMPEQQANPNGVPRSTTPSATPPALETALAQIEVVRGEFRNAIAGLNKLGEQLKAAAREQKASEKEVQSVRATIRSLQTVRI